MTGPALLSLLLRHKRLLLLSGLAMACLGFGISRMLPSAYLAEGNLIVENRSTSPTEATPSVMNNVATQSDVITSSGLIRHVVQSLDLVTVDSLQPRLRLPSQVAHWLATVKGYLQTLRAAVQEKPLKNDTTIDATLKYMQKHLTATAKENSSVIKVTFEAGSPETAALVVNSVMDTYLNTINEKRDAQINNANEWASEQIESRRAQIAITEQKITDFVQANHLSEVQGSLTAAIQLSKDQEQLVAARADLARKEAAYATAKNGGVQGAEETLGSKTIEEYKDLEAKTLGQMSSLGVDDPRRAALQRSLTALRQKIAAESELILASLARAVEIGRANVKALEKTINEEMIVSQNSSVAGARLKQLMSDLDTKRQAFISFLTAAAAVRVAAEQTPTAHILFTATPPDRPVRGYGSVSLVLGFIAGVAGAGGIIILRGVMRPRVTSTTEMESVTGLPAFGSLPDVRRNRMQPIVAETFRALCIRMRQHGIATILITSSEVHEGKTTVAKALAHRFAWDGFRVLLIDADLRRPSLAKALGLEPHYTLLSVINGLATLEQAALPLSGGLDGLLSVSPVDNPLKVLASDGFASLIEQCKRSYDFVVIDSPPVLHVADPLLLAKHCQRIIFIVRAGLAQEVVSEATHRFDKADRAKMHTILTRVAPSDLTILDNYSGYRA